MIKADNAKAASDKVVATAETVANEPATKRPAKKAVAKKRPTKTVAKRPVRQEGRCLQVIGRRDDGVAAPDVGNAVVVTAMADRSDARSTPR